MSDQASKFPPGAPGSGLPAEGAKPPASAEGTESVLPPRAAEGAESVLPPRAAELVAALKLEPLPHEGGLYRQNHQDQFSTAIYYLLAAPEFSALHQLQAAEVYHWYAGDPLQLAIVNPDGRVEEPIVGPDIAAGQLPQYVGPPGAWHGSQSTGEWTLVGTTMAPGFKWEDFQLANRAELIERFPHAAKIITEYTRDEDA